jgi:hypothetical protein
MTQAQPCETRLEVPASSDRQLDIGLAKRAFIVSRIGETGSSAPVRPSGVVTQKAPPSGLWVQHARWSQKQVKTARLIRFGYATSEPW